MTTGLNVRHQLAWRYFATHKNGNIDPQITNLIYGAVKMNIEAYTKQTKLVCAITSYRPSLDSLLR